MKWYTKVPIGLLLTTGYFYMLYQFDEVELFFWSLIIIPYMWFAFWILGGFDSHKREAKND